MVACVEDGVAEAAHFVLPDEMHARQATDGLTGGEGFGFVFRGEFVFEFTVRREVLLDGALTSPDDDEDVGDAAGDCFLDDVLNHRFVHDGQHFLGHGFADW